MRRTSARVIPGKEKKALLVSPSTEDGWVLSAMLYGWSKHEHCLSDVRFRPMADLRVSGSHLHQVIADHSAPPLPPRSVPPCQWVPPSSGDRGS